MKKLIAFLFRPPVNGANEIILIRLLAGGVFFWEGILKFVYTNQGLGRFTKLGFPYPEAMANFIGAVEIAGGLMLLLGFFTRPTALWFVFEMIIAILTTKVALYLGTSPLPLPPAPPKVGIWAVLHEIRSDYAQLLSCLYLLLAGPGRLSLDRTLHQLRNTMGKEV